MQLPLQITFRHMEPSEHIENLIRERAERLDRFAPDIMSCRVVVEPAGKHHQHGNMYEVRIDLTLPGEEIVVNREPSEHVEYKKIEVAIRDAFDVARRQLEDYVRRRRKEVKTPHIPPHGRVIRIFPEAGYGFILTPDGREIYFHRNSVLNGGFDRLEEGTEVSYTEEEGEKGPQASTVKPVGKHHHLL